MGICAKATILDPRFKKCAFGIADNASNAVNQLIQEISNALENEDVGVIVATGKVDQINEPPIKKVKKSIWNFFDEQKSKNTPKATRSSATRIQEDMALYLTKPLLDIDAVPKTSPLDFWKKHEDIMPHITEAAFKYLCVPATSVPSERVFSKAGQVCKERRNRLTAKHVEQMVFLNANQKYVT